MRTPILAVAAAVACHTAGPPVVSSAPADPELVHVDTGQLRGVTRPDTLAWLGIPYAAPPIGDLRWRPPAPVEPWAGVRPATGFGYACMQSGTSAAPNDTPMGSEDCLTLNVWRPPGDGVRPVMVFIHGGYFTWGASSYRKAGVDLYDGGELAARADAVVVTLNYRLGPFGFLAIDGGNFGLLDQIAALAWVQRNIAAFGGDPTRVVLFGQSAGAISTAALYASPRARGLFAAAIMHSGNGDAQPRDKAERTVAKLATKLGCDRDTAACLRAKTASAIAAALPEDLAPGGTRFGPIVDGDVLPDTPFALVRTGHGAGVPLVVATTASEFSTMIDHYLDGPIATADDYRRMVTRRFGATTAEGAIAAYPASAYASPLAAYTALLTDAAFACPSDAFADAASSHAPVYRFVFDHSYAGALARFGAGHGLDLFMVFRNLPRYVAFDSTERALSDQLVAAWSQLAHTGRLAWPARTETGGELELLDRDTLRATTATRASCALFARR